MYVAVEIMQSSSYHWFHCWTAHPPTNLFTITK